MLQTKFGDHSLIGSEEEDVEGFLLALAGPKRGKLN
jgi:hypothetical protein